MYRALSIELYRRYRYEDWTLLNWIRSMSDGIDTPHGRLKLARSKARGGIFEQPVDASRFFGWNENTYKAHENGIRNYPPKTAAKYARAFNVTPGWLLFGEGNKEPSQNRHIAPSIGALTLPLISWELFGSAMTVSEAAAQAKFNVEIPAIVPLSPLAYVTTIRDNDDSMVPHPPAPGDFFPPGTFLIMDPEGHPRPGDFVLAKVDGEPEAVFRRYRELTNGDHAQVEFVPLNSNYRTIRGKLDETVHIIARYVFDIKPRR